MALPKLSAFIRNLSKSTRLTNNVAASSNCIRFTDGERRCYSTAVHSLPKAQYGGRHTVTLIPGDGVGPELMTHVKEVLRYAGAPIDFEEVILNEDNVEDEAQLESVLLALKRNGVGLKGNIATGHLKEKQNQSTNLLLRTELDLFANVIHCKSVPGIETRHENVDIILIRENTEGEYKQLEHENVPGVVESLKIITEAKSTRIAKYAFDYAVQHNRKKVTAVHKANIMKLGDGLFLECCKKVSESYPNIEFDSMIVDNCSMQMVSKPQQFDVMVLPNLYGNIVNNIGAGLVGGAGITAGKNLGSDYAVFETGTRNTGKSIMGKNIANPSGMLLASALMLDHLGLFNHGKLIRESVMKVISEDMIHTPDLGGQATTLEVVQAVIKNIQSKTEKCNGYGKGWK